MPCERATQKQRVLVKNKEYRLKNKEEIAEKKTNI